MRDQACQGALTQKQTLWSRFEYRAAYDSQVRVELPLMPSARAAPPSGPSSFSLSLWAQRCLLFCQWALTQKQTLGSRFKFEAHSSFSIFVSLRTAASLEAPSAPILLERRLQRRGGARMVRNQVCQRALTQKQTLWGRIAPEAFDLRLREDFHELEQA